MSIGGGSGPGTVNRVALEPRVAAAIDIGSTSVHLLVAAVAGHLLRPLVDESVMMGLGARIDATGHLGAAVRAELVDVLAGYAEAAGRLGATSITFVGTEPMRRAADASRVVSETARVTGAPLYVLSHEEEAFLTLVGVTEGRIQPADVAVVDIGGGSTELVARGRDLSPAAVGLRVGSGSLTSAIVRNDPPTATEIAELRSEARRLLAEAPSLPISELIAVGGTASNLQRVLPVASPDRTLTPGRLTEVFAILATEPSALASERHGVRETRARILPAGAAILEAILERYRLDRVGVSEASIREGTVLAVVHAGSTWRERLPALARGWDG